MKKRILMIDDHQLFLAGLCDLVNREPDMEVVGVAGNGKEGVDLARTLLPDIAVLDIAMPGMSGIEAAKALRMFLPRIKMAALTMHLDKQMIQEAFKAGFGGYILKEATSQEFVYALRVLMSGEVFLSPKVATLILGDYMRFSAQNISGTATHEASLSEREKEILKFLVRGKSTRDIAEALHISKSTVDTHRRNILDKLGCENVTCLTRYALREGLVDLDDEI